MKIVRLILVVGSSCLLLATSPTPPPPAKKIGSVETIGRCLPAIARQLDFHGVVFVGDVSGTMSVAQAFSPESGPPGTVELTSPMNIGSSGKMFTAAAIGKLVSEGKVRFDQSVRRFLPDLPKVYEDVTIANLLNHSAGTGNYFRRDMIERVHSAKSVDDLMALVVETELAFAPGSQFQYSNSGYVILGAVVESVSGEAFGEYLRVHIFEPAGMSDTTLYKDEEGLTGFTRIDPGRRPGEPIDTTKPFRESSASRGHGSPAGGSFSTAADLGNFMRALLSFELMPQETVEQLFAYDPTLAGLPRREGPPAFYGSGFVISRDDDRVGHGGGAPGVNAEIRARRESGWVFAAITNTDPPAASTFVSQIERAIVDDEHGEICGTTGLQKE